MWRRYVPLDPVTFPGDRPLSLGTDPAGASATLPNDGGRAGYRFWGWDMSDLGFFGAMRGAVVLPGVRFTPAATSSW